MDETRTGEPGGHSGDEARDALKYRLYVGRLQPVPPEIEFSYYDSMRGYLFVFTDKEPEGAFAPMLDSLMDELNPGERSWYNAACYEVMRRWEAAHKSDAETAVKEFLDHFEEELKREAAKGADNGDGTEDIPSGGD